MSAPMHSRHGCVQSWPFWTRELKVRIAVQEQPECQIEAPDRVPHLQLKAENLREQEQDSFIKISCNWASGYVIQRLEQLGTAVLLNPSQPTVVRDTSISDWAYLEFCRRVNRERQKCLSVFLRTARGSFTKKD